MTKGRICSVSDCDKPLSAKGWCDTHYQRMRKTGSLELAPKLKRFCSVEGCSDTYFSTGFCRFHYGRKRNGVTLGQKPRPTTGALLSFIIDAHVQDRTLDENKCIEWPFYSGTNGASNIKYGQLTHRGEKWKAHQLAAYLAYGPVPDGMEVCHNCGNSLCVRPGHLRYGSHVENMADIKRGS